MEERGLLHLADADMEGNSWNHIRDVIGDEHWNWIFSEEGVGHVLNRPHLMYEGVTEALHELSKIAELTFITHRSPICAAATAQWLASHGAPFTSLHCIGSDDGDHLPKSVVQPQADIYVEDSPTNVTELLGSTTALVLCPRRSYNADLKPHKRLAMYDSLTDVVHTARLASRWL